MAEKIELTLNSLKFENLQAGTVGVDEFINDMFSNPQHHASMCLALKEYHRNDGGSPEVDAFEVVNTAYHAASLSGRFRCKFHINYHYTCSDVRNRLADTIDWTFRIDQDQGTVFLTGEETLERDYNEF